MQNACLIDASTRRYSVGEAAVCEIVALLTPQSGYCGGEAAASLRNGGRHVRVSFPFTFVFNREFFGDLEMVFLCLYLD